MTESEEFMCPYCKSPASYVGAGDESWCVCHECDVTLEFEYADWHQEQRKFLRRVWEGEQRNFENQQAQEDQE